MSRITSVRESLIGTEDPDDLMIDIISLLEEGDKVKVNIMFFGRMMAHKDLGLVLMEKFQNAVGEAGIVEQPVRNEGRSMFMIMAPPKKK